jgi:urea transporter/murein DD-endopeptidase MepM/ murein hydrolase activator NlpD
MIEKIKNYILLFYRSTFNSYTAVYFSDNKLFALLLIGVTFISPQAGLSGLIAIVVSNLLAYLMGYNEFTISRGYYGFNSLLVGLGLGVTYDPGLAFYFLLVFASMLTLFITIAMEGVIGKYALPFLSVPFLLAIWLISIATKHYTSLVISQNGIYILNEIYSAGGTEMVNQYHQLNNLNIPESLNIYFKSIGAIFFQYNVLAGIIIALGILICSRISFTLSLIGFYTAYFFYKFIGGDINELSYNYIGFNFILTAIALGGFFIVPSRASYFWVILLTPLIAIVTSASTVVFWTFQLSIFSLPFNVIVLIFLYILKFRVKSTLLVEEVIYQQYSPEKNLYSQQNNKKRFKNTFYFPVSLPFWGEWTISQGNEGKQTHKGEWKHAWDFVIKNFEDRTFSGNGIHKKDFYCFEKPVLAPADGEVETVINYIEDNEIGDVNVNDNWGNTIVIKHSQFLYSKICHLKKDSIKCKKGDKIKRGDVIAACGNSGRSPEPHIHFQLQANPFTDAKTIDFPVNYYILRTKEGHEFKQFEKPKEGEIVSNIDKNILMTEAYKFLPGKKFKFLVKDSDKEKDEIVEWEVEVDYYNNSYIYCKNTRSKAFFSNDGNIHYFRHFEGDKDSLLFYFFMASYKVMTGFYKDLTLNDQYPVHLLNNRILLFFQDFIAPFFMFIKSDYTLSYDYIDDIITSNAIRFKSRAEMKIGSMVRKKMEFETVLKNDKIYSIVADYKNRKIEAVCTE